MPQNTHSMTTEADTPMAWQRIEPPLYWHAIKDHIVADRCLPDGTRQHMVRGHTAPGRVVCSAQIIGLADCPEAQYSAELSHLSENQGVQHANAND